MKQILLLLTTLLSILTMNAQKEISGIISDAYSILPDAHVLNQTTKKGTISNSEGAFTIEVNKNDVLTISHIGYKTVELSVLNYKKQIISLEIENSLDEVVVTAQVIKREYHRFACSWSYKSECKGESRQHRCNTKTTGVKIETVIIPVKQRAASMYPNPSKTGVFNLKMEQPFNSLKIEVFTLSGQFVLKKTIRVFSNQTTIDLLNYPDGMYIINYEVDGEKQTPKKAIIG